MHMEKKTLHLTEVKGEIYNNRERLEKRIG